MRASWGAPGGQTYQGSNNVLTVQSNNALKRALKAQSDALQIDHQQEDLVDGGKATTIQFHYLLVPDTTGMGATTVAKGAFDANTGTAGSLTPAATAFGTAQYVFKTRRDFRGQSRGF